MKERKGERLAKKLDQIIVIDVESTCWQGPPPRGQESEGRLPHQAGTGAEGKV